MFQTKGVQITWLGHSAFRVRSGGKTFYIDPFLSSNPKCPENEKNPAAIDAILLTHGHADHVGDTVALARHGQPKVVGNYELSLYLAGRGVPAAQLLGMGKGGTAAVAGAKVTMVHADHSSSMEQDGVSLYLGEPAGLVIEFAEGLRIYHAGDTAVFGDMKLIGELYHPDVALLPIGGFYTMDPLEAAHACRLLGVGAVIPMHFGTFPALAGTPAELKRRLAELGVPCEVLELQPGQTL